jgi:hypothetical protein
MKDPMVGLAAVLQILLGFLACTVTALSLGVTLLRILRLRLNRAEAVCLGYVVGSALTSTLTLAIAVLWIAWRGVFLALAGGSLILLWSERRWWSGLKPASLLTIPRALRLLYYAALLAYGVLYFRQALSPEMSPDGMAYHLGLVNLWNHAHGLARNMGMHASKPQGMEMLFLFAFAIGRHSAAALVHFSFLMALPWLMVLFGLRFGWPRGAAVLAAILTFASPLVGVDGAAAYNDVALAAVAFAILFLFEIWRRERTSGSLLAASLLTGFALAMKSTSVFLVVFVVAALLWELRRSPRRLAARTLMLAVVAIAAVSAPYFIRNAIWFQNPIAFFGNRIFPNRWFHVSFEQAYIQNQAHLNGITWSEMPRELTFGGPKMQESFGPAFVLLPLALAGLIWPRTRFLLLAALSVAFPFAAIKSARFLIPAVPLVAMVAAFVLCRLPRSSLLAGGIALLHLVVSWPSINNRLHISSGWRIVYHVPWKTALRQEPEEGFLSQSDEYVMARLVETHVPLGEPVLSLNASVAQAYTLRPILVAWESAFAERMSDLIFGAADSPRDGSRTWTATFPPSRVRELRIIQTGRGTGQAMWSVNEIRLWAAGAPVPYSPLWRLRAWPDPWDIGLAFDGSEATRWRSWDTLRPGMWIDIQLDRAVALDRVDVLSHDGQWESRMAVSLLTESGEWKPAIQSSWRIDPPLDLRRQAAMELKRSGVRFIEVSREEWNGWPFHADFAGWGVRQVAANRQSVLLRVD